MKFVASFSQHQTHFSLSLSLSLFLNKLQLILTHFLSFQRSKVLYIFFFSFFWKQSCLFFGHQAPFFSYYFLPIRMESSSFLYYTAKEGENFLKHAVVQLVTAHVSFFFFTVNAFSPKQHLGTSQFFLYSKLCNVQLFFSGGVSLRGLLLNFL
ncbi:unnamed protein product [Acanthosepion pharaonis]|uniref:Uncharacterized protein n=1 Tax=Acanthosepion pharaonis TaxID=158019 RepID=A0A812CMP2_ACAPH|nr:unnamed protein product [Sepia pharaonis]